MPSTRTYLLLLLLFCLVSSISGNSHIRRTRPNDDSSQRVNQRGGLSIQDLLNEPGSPNENGKRPMSQQQSSTQRECDDTEQQSPEPKIDHELDQRKISSYALRLPQAGETSEARFNNEAPDPEVHSTTADGTSLMHVPSNNGQNQEGNRKKPLMGGLVVYLTTRGPIMVAFPGEVLDPAWKEARKAQAQTERAILEEHRQKLQDALQGEPKDVEFRGVVLLANLKDQLQDRLALWGAVLVQFQDLTKSYGEFKVDTVRIYNWSFFTKDTKMNNDCRVKCDHRENLPTLKAQGTLCQVYLYRGKNAKHNVLWDFELASTGESVLVSHEASSPKRQAKIRDLVQMKMGRMKTYGQLDPSETEFAP